MSTNKKIEFIKLEDDENFVKPKQSFTERLSLDEIADLLSDYEPIDAKNITHGVHIRYQKKNKKTHKYDFRMGGTIFKIEPEYFMVSNGKHIWSVQKKDTKFYKKMNFAEKEKEFEETLYNKNQEIKTSNSIISTQQKEIKQQNTFIQKLIDKIDKLNKKIKLIEKK